MRVLQGVEGKRETDVNAHTSLCLAHRVNLIETFDSLIPLADVAMYIHTAPTPLHTLLQQKRKWKRKIDESGKSVTNKTFSI